MVLDLEYNLRRVMKFIDEEFEKMYERAPEVWMRPELPKCEHCGQDNSVQPSFENTKKKNINWLFLLLGQTIGCCTLAQIKYFLKHNDYHRTGSKDHVLYDSYICLCNQLIPHSFPHPVRPSQELDRSALTRTRSFGHKGTFHQASIVRPYWRQVFRHSTIRPSKFRLIGRSSRTPGSTDGYSGKCSLETILLTRASSSDWSTLQSIIIYFL
ncbi:hypothetical protein VIGAN_05077000 [Vigna angularis var. angularis]|uniref:DUF7086 domain-containing protein n=1 Tax=Vigna angularis var. angularis TaxID=157739 RepID=A0A0S3S3M0_PHAAN|nr:hypothetical protein VIGAN_05077000 [Vigna angularis var. angularis]